MSAREVWEDLAILSRGAGRERDHAAAGNALKEVDLGARAELQDAASEEIFGEGRELRRRETESGSEAGRIEVEDEVGAEAAGVEAGQAVGGAFRVERAHGGGGMESYGADVGERARAVDEAERRFGREAKSLDEALGGCGVVGGKR